MTADTLAFVDGFDAGVLFKPDIERMLGQTVPISIHIDLKSLFDVIPRSKYTT